MLGHRNGLDTDDVDQPTEAKFYVLRIQQAMVNVLNSHLNPDYGDYMRKCRNLSINAGSVAGLSI